MNRERKRIAQPVLRLRNVAREEYGHGRQVSQSVVAVRVVGVDCDARAVADDVAVHVVNANPQRGEQPALLRCVEPRVKPVVRERERPSDSAGGLIRISVRAEAAGIPGR